jgi:hypothetical protein
MTRLTLRICTRSKRITTVFAHESVLAIERALIRAGVRFPAGGSLLLVAQRN